MQFELLKSFAQQGPLTVVVNGDCMQRTIPDGSFVRLDYKRDYWPGDALAFKRHDGKIVCHRFLGYIPTPGGWRVITRAENSRRADTPVFIRHVLGRVVMVDNSQFCPDMRDRLRALGKYFSAVMQLLLVRFKVHREKQQNKND